MTKLVKTGDSYTSYMYCQSRIRGMKCPLEGRPGKKAFELCNDCFELVKGAETKQ